jgi:hypothetical protein
MADQAEQVSTTELVDTKQQPGPTKRRQYSEALRRQIVAETLAPGVSVSIVARRHDVNSNQLLWGLIMSPCSRQCRVALGRAHGADIGSGVPVAKASAGGSDSDLRLYRVPKRREGRWLLRAKGQTSDFDQTMW